jgi:A/G-specific adenine glycosylase
MADFTTLIQEWYRLNQRDLPWRHTNDPYKIWLSEVILQQTRVDQGLNYYLKFTTQFPTVFDLAKAAEDEVLNLWQGLGYYSRARNLHASAKQVVADFGGVFPTNFEGIKSLKGVGDYTASAIASICYGLPHAVVDGNVYRVLSRYLEISTPIDSTQGKKDFAEIAGEFLDVQNPGDHNQALMEIGALICLPKNPSCQNCPLVGSCAAYRSKTQLSFPVKAKRTKVVKRYLNYLVLFNGKNTVIQKRVGKGIWQGLYDFPFIEKEKLNGLELSELNQYEPVEIIQDGQFKHILSHQELYVSFWIVKVVKFDLNENQIIVPIAAIETFPLPQLLIRYINQSRLFGAD